MVYAWTPSPHPLLFNSHFNSSRILSHASRSSLTITSFSSSLRRATILRRPRTTPCMSTSNEEVLDIQIVSVPDGEYMLTPGEVRPVSLDYNLFHSILKTGSTLFGCVTVEDWSSTTDLKTRGSLLSILSIKHVIPNAGNEKEDDMSLLPKVMVECRCTGRFDVIRLTDYAFIPGVDPPPPMWKLVHGECSPIRDWACWEFEDRLKLATIEWDVWQSCREVALLMRKLGVSSDVMPFVEQELAVWAPRTYDRDISESEWKDTPVATRSVWSQRAESFSFGILRCVSSDDDVMRIARGLTDTVARLELAMEHVEKKKAMTQARISLKDALN